MRQRWWSSRVCISVSAPKLRLRLLLNSRGALVENEGNSVGELPKAKAVKLNFLLKKYLEAIFLELSWLIHYLYFRI